MTSFTPTPSGSRRARPLELSERDAAALAPDVDGWSAGSRWPESQPEVVERLNALLALARPRPYATDHDGELHLHYARPTPRCSSS